MSTDKPITQIYEAAAIQDAAGHVARPGRVAVARGKILGAGPVDAVKESDFEHPHLIKLPETLLLPALVNAHAHLDLTTLGPLPPAGTFVDWLRLVMQRRPRTTSEIIQAVNQGLRLSLESGVGWVGDIAGSLDALEARLTCASSADPSDAALDISSPAGVSFLECFGFGAGASHARQELQQLHALASRWKQSPVMLGIQPHAPYSAGDELYDLANQLSLKHGYRLSTHMAESLDEIAFVRDASGPFADLLRDLGKWDDSIQPTHQHPVDWLAPRLREQPWLLAHCNEVQDTHITLLAECGASVAYCPIASEYFGHPHRGTHRYRDMLDADVNVCLGTDSIVCQPAGEPQPLGIFAQMRRLHRRDGTDPATLLAMATVNGIKAMGLLEKNATFHPGTPARIAAVRFDVATSTDPLTQALNNNHPLYTLGIGGQS